MSREAIEKEIAVGSEPYSQESQPWPEQPPSSYPPSYGSEGAYPPPPAYPSQPLYPPPTPFGGIVPPPAYPAQPAPVYGQPYAQPYGVPIPFAAPDPGSGMAVASMVLGIISLVFTALFFCGGLFVAPITGIVGLVLGILGRKSVTRHGSAIAGIVMSIVALAITGTAVALYIILVVLSAATAPTQ